MAGDRITKRPALLRILIRKVLIVYSTFQETCHVPNTVLGIMENKAINQFYILISANKEVKKTSRNVVE